jgi:hypothetical protein
MVSGSFEWPSHGHIDGTFSWAEPPTEEQIELTPLKLKRANEELRNVMKRAPSLCEAVSYLAAGN